MAKTSETLTAVQVHCDAFRRANADLDIRRPTHDLTATPLDGLATDQSCDVLTAYQPRMIMVRRSAVTIITRRTSFDVWATLACLEDLLSDYRRIAPRYSFMQTAGEATIAVGNEYRLTLSDSSLLDATNSALGLLDPAQSDLTRLDQRVMDVRVARTGPWGGETGELVVEPLENHALAGASSLWLLAHDHADEGNMRVSLDACEIARWAWAPDLVANQHGGDVTVGARIINWDYLFERLAQALDGIPEQTAHADNFSVTDFPETVTEDDRIIDALRIHSGLKQYFEQLASL
jgi:hypothetical protein